MYLNNNMHTKDNQELKALTDKDKKGKERPWRENQLKKIPLEESYTRIGFDNKAFRVRNCSRQLVFKVNPDSGEKKLHSMISCQVRLCPMCNWRRSLKIYGQLSKIMDKALEDREYRFIFLTLTCENIKGEKLSETIDKLFHAFNLLTKRKAFKQAAKGWFRALEITHNLNAKSKSYDTYHPHFHIVLMVNKSYFTDPKIYITQEKWTSLWKSCLKVDYSPIVHVTAFKTETRKKTTKSVAEAAKYTVKDTDYLIPGDEELTDKTVMVLDGALSNRRLVAFGGELRKIHKELNLDDAIDGDLRNTDNEDDDMRKDLEYILEVYDWHVGYKQYIKRS